jgi:hypothetical protein
MKVQNKRIITEVFKIYGAVQEKLQQARKK